MKLISSKATFFYKRVFPAIWLAFPSLAILGLLAGAVRQNHSSLRFILVPVGMAAFGYFLFKRLLFDLVDEVYDLGHALLIRNRGKDVEVPLSNVINVGSASFQNPPRITLTLREPCELGKEITFMPPHRWNPFSESPLAKELIERVDAARRSRS